MLPAYRLWLPYLVGLALTCVSTAAPAYVRSRSRGMPVRWADPKLVITLQDPSPNAGFTLAELHREVQAAVDSWLSPCTRLTVTLRDGLAPGGRAERDQQNTMVTRTRAWCPDGAARHNGCYDTRLQARTTLRFLPGPPREGERAIAEADLEINAVDYRWSTGLDDRRDEGLVNLRSVLVHEFGHVFGLAHDCGIGKAFIDAETRSRRLPTCTETRDLSTAMFAGPGEEGRALVFAPVEVERRALCELYPRIAPSGRVEAPGREGAKTFWCMPAVLLVAGARRLGRSRKSVA